VAGIPLMLVVAILSLCPFIACYFALVLFISKGFPHLATRVYSFTPECTASYPLLPFMLHTSRLCLAGPSYETTVLLEPLDCSFFLSSIIFFFLLFL
jgi:hypothetical protein